MHKINYYIAKIWKILTKNDPYYSCKFYKEQGCVHVDGPICTFPHCSLNDSYCIEKDNVYYNEQN